MAPRRFPFCWPSACWLVCLFCTLVAQQQRTARKRVDVIAGKSRRPASCRRTTHITSPLLFVHTLLQQQQLSPFLSIFFCGFAMMGDYVYCNTGARGDGRRPLQVTRSWHRRALVARALVARKAQAEEAVSRVHVRVARLQARWSSTPLNKVTTPLCPNGRLRARRVCVCGTTAGQVHRSHESTLARVHSQVHVWCTVSVLESVESSEEKLRKGLRKFSIHCAGGDRRLRDSTTVAVIEVACCRRTVTVRRARLFGAGSASAVAVTTGTADPGDG
jgi:hypothetical protein